MDKGKLIEELWLISKVGRFPYGYWSEKSKLDFAYVFRTYCEEILKLNKKEIIGLESENFLGGDLQLFLHGWQKFYDSSIIDLVMDAYEDVDILDFSKRKRGFFVRNGVLNLENIKLVFDHMLKNEEISIQDIPYKVTRRLLKDYRLGNLIGKDKYPGIYTIYDLVVLIYPEFRDRKDEFRIIKKRYKNKDGLNIPVIKSIFDNMLQKEKIKIDEIPERVTGRLLNKYNLKGLASHSSRYNIQGIYGLVSLLYPEYPWDKEQFRKSGERKKR